MDSALRSYLWNPDSRHYRGHCLWCGILRGTTVAHSSSLELFGFQLTVCGDTSHFNHSDAKTASLPTDFLVSLSVAVFRLFRRKVDHGDSGFQWG